MVDPLQIAGRTVLDPITVLTEYAEKHSRTLRNFDFREQRDMDTISLEDVTATRVIASRISRVQADEIVARARASGDLLSQIRRDARLQDADPAQSDGLYDQMTELYTALQGPGVRDSKVSKVLHLKRPRLYPILDRQLARLYDQPSRVAAQDYPDRNFKRMRWAAIRRDLIQNEQTLAALRSEIEVNQTLRQHRVHKLGDLRILDILAWKTQHG